MDLSHLQNWGKILEQLTMKKLIINYDNDNFPHIKADYLQDCDIDFSAKIYISGYAAHSISKK
jgi:hypothetical protein